MPSVLSGTAIPESTDARKPIDGGSTTALGLFDDEVVAMLQSLKGRRGGFLQFHGH